MKEEADGGVGGLGRRSLRAAQGRLAAQESGERVGLAGSQADLGVGGADIQAAVVVGARDRPDGHGHGFATVLFGEARDEGGRGGDELRADPVLDLSGAAVARLPQGEQQHELLVVLRAQLGDDGHGVGQRVRQAFATQVVGELEDVEAQLADLTMARFVDLPDQHVHVQGFGRKEGADLFADGEVGIVGKLQRAGDRVVVGERHMGHAARLGFAVDEVRIGEALAYAERTSQVQLGARREA